jgi:hypothetical protein
MRVIFATTEAGQNVPVIDVTNPAFSLDALTEEKLAKIAEQTLKIAEVAVKMKKSNVTGADRSSRLLSRDENSSYYTGMVTYFNKLGSENLHDSFATAHDRKMADTIAPIAMRLRLHAIAQHLADNLEMLLARRPTQDLHLLNIGGGTGVDSWNGIILLNQKNPELLHARKTVIELLDIDLVAPNFGVRALHALRDESAPLANVAVTLKYVHYNWNDVSALRNLLIQIDAQRGVVAASSEGGLLEYGSDDAIAENLTILKEQTGDTFFFVCSIFRDEQSIDSSVRLAKANSQLGIRFLGRREFTNLSHRLGWVTRWAKDNNPVFQIAVLSKRK